MLISSIHWCEHAMQLPFYGCYMLLFLSSASWIGIPWQTKVTSCAKVSKSLCTKNQFLAYPRWNHGQVICRWSAHAQCFHWHQSASRITFLSLSLHLMPIFSVIFTYLLLSPQPLDVIMLSRVRKLLVILAMLPLPKITSKLPVILPVIYR